ncbi:MAG: alanine--tRNA ligase-related protein [Patescibacteria group bacterium]|nr:alanine--tRNA ligase-related protein [Patescibacteria group bacterium]
MRTSELREKFLKFLEERGHKIIKSSSLVPENDPTTLFTGSGMQPLLPYLLGRPHPDGKRIADSQKCFRAEDIEEVGDNRHTTFFEMLGNWSFGDYFKQEQLSRLFEFLTSRPEDGGIGLDPRKLYVTVFAGDKETGIPADEESIEIWKKLFAEKGIEAEYVALGSNENGNEVGMRNGRIFSYNVRKNWWSRAGVPSKMPAGEPGGPDSEVFYDFATAHDPKFGRECHPNCDCGRFLEIGNSVFMEYVKKDDGSFGKLAQRNVDFGGGLERLTAAANDDPDVFNIDVFSAAKDYLERETGKSYADNKKAFRIILDHIRAVVFLISDGVVPSNVGRGYLVRRLLRRAVRFGDELGAVQGRESARSSLSSVATAFIDEYKMAYPSLAKQAEFVLNEMEMEEKKFRSTLKEGLREMERILANGVPVGNEIDPEKVFFIYQTYGFPIELIEEELAKRSLFVDKEKVKAEMKKHQELSRIASTGVFKGGLADSSEIVTRLHTAHHLLLKALQIVLGPEVKQRGSNITAERLRMDFSYGSRMTEEQKKEVERIVNEKIAEDLPVIRTEMPTEEAEKLNAEREFGQKYPDVVSVYSIGPKSATQDDPKFKEAFSIEFCGGPHIRRTGELGGFEIMKEEAVSSGIRRIRANIVKRES